MTRSVTVVVGGEGPVPDRPPPPGSVVVAADGGLGVAQALGLAADHLVGDLDSVEPRAIDAARSAGVSIHRHQADKDATDSELALELALELLAAEGGALPTLTVLGRGGGRLDHLLADVFLLGGRRLGHVEVTAHFGPATLSVVRPGTQRRLHGARGDQVSLLPVHGGARGVTTSGLRWTLHDAVLEPGSSRGVSNEFVDSEATVASESGIVLAVQPGTRAPTVPERAGPYDPSPSGPGAG